MSGLFDQDPVFTQKKRDSKGRFATAERAMYDKALKENNWLRFQVEKFRRQAEAANGAFIAQQRIIASLREELAQTKKIIKNVRQRIR